MTQTYGGRGAIPEELVEWIVTFQEAWREHGQHILVEEDDGILFLQVAGDPFQRSFAPMTLLHYWKTAEYVPLREVRGHRTVPALSPAAARLLIAAECGDYASLAGAKVAAIRRTLNAILAGPQQEVRHVA